MDEKTFLEGLQLEVAAHPLNLAKVDGRKFGPVQKGVVSLVIIGFVLRSGRGGLGGCFLTKQQRREDEQAGGEGDTTHNTRAIVSHTTRTQFLHTHTPRNAGPHPIVGREGGRDAHPS